MLENGKSRKRQQLTPEEKWEIFLEVTSQEISQADAARKYGVDVSVIICLRALAKDAAFASAKPGRPASAEAVEVELLRAENDRLGDSAVMRSRRPEGRWPATPGPARRRLNLDPPRSCGG